ncbi:MAG: 5-oxoprolinase subunit B family protein [Streptosporangiales bacterium]
MRTLTCGDAAVLVEVDGLDMVLRLAAALRAAPIPAVLDVVPAARTLLLRFDPELTDAAAVARAVADTEPVPPDALDTEEPVEMPVIYDGADLAEVADLTGLGERGVIEAHTAASWTVAFCGFAPGFGYLAASDWELSVPRRETSRTDVPPGAVALAAEFSAVYPRRSPGGWQLIGHTDLAVWDIDRDPAALLRPGVRVRFVEAAA